MSVATQAHFEIERKYRSNQEELLRLVLKMHRDGFVLEGCELLTDTFLPIAAPNVMRIRESEDGRCWLTTKQQVIVEEQKEKQEREEPLTPLARECLLKLAGEANSGKKLLSYTKERTTYLTHSKGFEIRVCLDVVTELGKYSGCYVELEIIAQEGQRISAVRKQITSLAQELLGPGRRPVRLSYPQMLNKINV